jgi:aminoglycoside phosphotransferase (APT) family kinase protein
MGHCSKNFNPKEEKHRAVDHPHDLVDMDTTSFERAVESDFGLHLTRVEKVKNGYQNQVYKGINANGETIFVRISKKKSVFETERFGYRTFEQLGIPFPRTIAYQEKPPTIGFPTMIMHSAEGTCLEGLELSPEHERAVYESLGGILRKVHGVKLEGFGPLRVTDGQLKGEFKSYAEYYEFLKYDFDNVKDLLKSHEVMGPMEIANLDELFCEISSLDIKDAFLLQGDLCKGHVFIKGDRITGVIDLGRLMAGDPRRDFAKCLLFQNKTQQEHFKRGYGELANDPIVPKLMAISLATKKVNEIFNRKGLVRAYGKPPG